MKTADELYQYRVRVPRGVTGGERGKYTKVTLILEDGREIALPNVVDVNLEHKCGSLSTLTIKVLGAYTESGV